MTQAVARRLQASAERCTTWVQTCMFRWDGQAPSDVDIAAYLNVPKVVTKELIDQACAAYFVDL